MPRADLEREILASLDEQRFDEAAERTLRGLGPHILGFLRSVIGDADEANDAFSIFCEEVWRGMSSFRRESSVESWCYGVAWHAARRIFRDPHRRRRVTFSSGVAERLATELRSSTASYLQSEARLRVEALRAALSPEERTILALRVDRGLAWREVARILSEAGDETFTDATVRKRYERIKDRIREQLSADRGR